MSSEEETILPPGGSESDEIDTLHEDTQLEAGPRDQDGK